MKGCSHHYGVYNSTTIVAAQDILLCTYYWWGWGKSWNFKSTTGRTNLQSIKTVNVLAILCARALELF